MLTGFCVYPSQPVYAASHLWYNQRDSDGVISYWSNPFYQIGTFIERNFHLLPDMYFYLLPDRNIDLNETFLNSENLTGMGLGK